MKYSISKLFALAGLIALLASICSRIFESNKVLDMMLHDTYYVIAYCYIFLFLTLLLGFFSLLYFIFPMVFRRHLNRKAGIIHFIMTVLGVLALCWMLYYRGTLGLPAIYNDYESHNGLIYQDPPHKMIVLIGLALLAGQLLFVLNMVFSAFSGTRTQRK